MTFIYVLFLPVAIIIIIHFLNYLFKGKRLTSGIADIFSYGIFPIIYLSQELNMVNNCCYDTAFFSPQHRVTIFSLIIICIVNYFFCLIRKKVASPIIEILVNSILMLAILINITIILHAYNSKVDADPMIPGIVPIILLSIMMLSKNSQMFFEEWEYIQELPTNKIARFAWKILKLPPFSIPCPLNNLLSDNICDHCYSFTVWSKT